MRKLFAGTLAFTTFPIFAQPALSLPSHPIQGHDAAEIASFCGAVGGAFGIWDSPGGGGVVYMCEWGGVNEAGLVKQRVGCEATGPGAKGQCWSNYDPTDPRAPKLPAPKGKRGGTSKNDAPKTSGKANTTTSFSNTRNVSGGMPSAAVRKASTPSTEVSTATTSTSPPMAQTKTSPPKPATVSNEGIAKRVGAGRF